MAVAFSMVDTSVVCRSKCLALVLNAGVRRLYGDGLASGLGFSLCDRLLCECSTSVFLG